MFWSRILKKNVALKAEEGQEGLILPVQPSWCRRYWLELYSLRHPCGSAVQTLQVRPMMKNITGDSFVPCAFSPTYRRSLSRFAAGPPDHMEDAADEFGFGRGSREERGYLPPFLPKLRPPLSRMKKKEKFLPPPLSPPKKKKEEERKKNPDTGEGAREQTQTQTPSPLPLPSPIFFHFSFFCLIFFFFLIFCFFLIFDHYFHFSYARLGSLRSFGGLWVRRGSHKIK